MPSIRDPEVETLATFSRTLRADYQTLDDGLWQGSPFDWIRAKPSRQKGAIGEKLVSGYLACKGFDVARSPDAEADRLIGGRRAEIKMSMLWKNGAYKFQQLRDQNYEFAVCLGICPFDAHCWILPKEAILKNWAEGAEGMRPQHGGSGGRDTAWLSVKPDRVPGWLHEWGGSLSRAAETISRITGQKPLE